MTISLRGGVSNDGALQINDVDILNITSTGASAASGKTLEATSGPSGSSFAFRNVLINGAMGIDQRKSGASLTITAAAALAYTVDRWYGYCTGANVTGQRVAGTAPNKYNYQLTGAASVTKIGFAQRIEAENCQHLAGTTATLAVDLKNSLLTTVTWTAWYANTADTFGTLASPTRTQIATGTFTVSFTLARYSTNITVPSGATTGIEIEFSVAAQTSGTWTIGRVQLEAGSVATPFEVRPVGTELSLCQRYYEKSYNLDVTPATVTNVGALPTAANGAGAVEFAVIYKVSKRLTPATIVNYSPATGASAKVRNESGAADVVASTGNAGMYGHRVYAALSANSVGSLHYTADAEL